MIGIKDKEVMRQLLTVEYHPILQDVLDWIDEEYPGLIIFTSAYRKGDPKCHGTIPCRAVDLRSKMFIDPYAVRDFINKHWQYDPTRLGQYKVCKYHKVKGGGWHFHIQVHDHTIRRKI